MKYMNIARKFGRQAIVPVAGFSLLTVSAASNAAGWDYSTITSGIDMSTVATGVIGVAAILAVVYAGMKGAKALLSFIRS